jgi:HPt (histidine-containing phosphotransfer) domain-containing protein
MHSTLATTITRVCGLRAPIDSALFRETWNVEPQNQRALLAEYAAASAADMADLQSAAHRHQSRELLRIAHRLAGASQIVGALRVAAACRRLEQALRNRVWPEVAGLVESVCRELGRVDEYINSI